MAGKHDQIAASLIKDILSGHYRVDERLPSERDLAVRFDANRGAVREAMKKLEQLSIAEVKPGGARVLDRARALGVSPQLAASLLASPPPARERAAAECPRGSTAKAACESGRARGRGREEIEGVAAT